MVACNTASHSAKAYFKSLALIIYPWKYFVLGVFFIYLNTHFTHLKLNFIRICILNNRNNPKYVGSDKNPVSIVYILYSYNVKYNIRQIHTRNII